MGIANKLNGNQRKDTVREGIDTKDIGYISAADLAELDSKDFPLPLAGFFIKTGDYGKQVTVIIENDGEYTGVNLPKRYVDMFEGLDADEIEAVKAGKLLIASAEGNVKTPKGKTTMIEFVDLDED